MEATGANPQSSIPCYVKGPNPACAQGRSIPRDVFVHLARVPIKSIQSVFRPNPDKSIVILNDGRNNILRESVVRRQMLESDGGCLGVNQSQRGAEQDQEKGNHSDDHGIA